LKISVQRRSRSLSVGGDIWRLDCIRIWNFILFRTQQNSTYPG